MRTLSSEYFEFKSVWESVNVRYRLANLLIERIGLTEQRLPQKLLEETALLVKKSKAVGLDKDKSSNK